MVCQGHIKCDDQRSGGQGPWCVRLPRGGLWFIRVHDMSKQMQDPPGTDTASPRKRASQQTEHWSLSVFGCTVIMKNPVWAVCVAESEDPDSSTCSISQGLSSTFWTLFTVALLCTCFCVIWETPLLAAPLEGTSSESPANTFNAHVGNPNCPEQHTPTSRHKAGEG